MATAINFDKYDIWKHLKEPLLKIHEITRIQQKYMILRGVFLRVIFSISNLFIFQLFIKYRRTTAINFYIYETLLKIHEITRIEQKCMILVGLFVKIIIFELLRKYTRSTAVSFDNYHVWKYLKEPLLKIHEITGIQLKYMILRVLFVKVILYQLLRKYLKEPLRKIHQITEIQRKQMIFRELFVKVTIFELFKKIQYGYCR